MLAPAGSISVIWLDLDRSSQVVDELGALLNPDERARVARLATPLERSRATVRLGRRREVLGEVFALAPEKVVTRYLANGQPHAISPLGDTLEISASHRDDLGLIALARESKVGVDVEATFELPDPDQFAQWVTAAEELREINELTLAERPAACLRLWTRKEAYLKATGEGIGGGLRHVRVPLDTDAWAESFRPVPDGPQWLLYELAVARDGLNASLVTSVGKDHHEPQVFITRR
jgi:4'-phosphopantetheinyl transferase